MKLKKIILCLLSIFLFSLIGCGAVKYYNSKIEINEKNGESYELTVSESVLVLSIPKKDLNRIEVKRQGATENPRYFSFYNPSRNLNVSGWFEPDYLYPGMVKYYTQMGQNLSDAGMPTPINGKFFKHRFWRINSYEIPCQSGKHTPNLHAHIWQDGTWINLHLSYDCDSKKTVEDLIAFLDSITLRVHSKNN